MTLAGLHPVRTRSLALLLSLGLAGALLAQGLVAVPALTARVVDTTATLAPDQRARLEAKLQAFERSQGTQIVVLLVPTTQPEDIAAYTQRVGDAWKIGRKSVGDGLLLVVAKNDRSLRIAPAKALEGAVPDLAARQVIERWITPRFREGDYAGGLDAGLDALMALVRGEALPPPAQRPEGNAMGWESLLVFLFVAVPVLGRVLGALLGRRKGAVLTGGGVGLLAWTLGTGGVLAVLAAVVAGLFALASGLGPARRSWPGRPGLPTGWHGHGGGAGAGHGNGPGGFASGGGGDFGGGGASGRW